MLLSWSAEGALQARSACDAQRTLLLPYMLDTYPPYLDQGLIQTVSTVSGPRYS